MTPQEGSKARLTNRTLHAASPDRTAGAARHQAAREPGVVADRAPTGVWAQLATTFADTPHLTAEITRMAAELAGARLDLANLAAAALAAMAAHQEGEPDPLSYLRDELAAQGYKPDRSRR